MPDAETNMPPTPQGEQPGATAFSAGELCALRYVSWGKVRRVYVYDPLIADLRKLTLVDVQGEFSGATEFGLEILATTPREESAR